MRRKVFEHTTIDKAATVDNARAIYGDSYVDKLRADYFGKDIWFDILCEMMEEREYRFNERVGRKIKTVPEVVKRQVDLGCWK